MVITLLEPPGSHQAHQNYWTEVWKKQDDQRPSFADITNYTVQSFPAELRASPDGLSAEEVR